MDDPESIRRFIQQMNRIQTPLEANPSALPAEHEQLIEADATPNEADRATIGNPTNNAAAEANGANQAARGVARTPSHETSTRQSQLTSPDQPKPSPHISGLQAPHNTPQTAPSSPQIQARKTYDEDVGEAISDYVKNMEGRPLSDSIWAPRPGRYQPSVLSGARSSTKTLTPVNAVQVNPAINDTFTRMSFQAADPDHEVDDNLIGEHVLGFRKSESASVAVSNNLPALGKSGGGIDSPKPTSSKQEKKLPSTSKEAIVSQHLQGNNSPSSSGSASQSTKDVIQETSLVVSKSGVLGPSQHNNDQSTEDRSRAPTNKTDLPTDFMDRWAPPMKKPNQTVAVSPSVSSQAVMADKESPPPQETSDLSAELQEPAPVSDLPLVASSKVASETIIGLTDNARTDTDALHQHLAQLRHSDVSDSKQISMLKEIEDQLLARSQKPKNAQEGQSMEHIKSEGNSINSNYGFPSPIYVKGASLEVPEATTTSEPHPGASSPISSPFSNIAAEYDSVAPSKKALESTLANEIANTVVAAALAKHTVSGPPVNHKAAEPAMEAAKGTTPATEASKKNEDREHKDIFNSWPRLEERARPAAKVRKVIIKELPPGATPAFVASLIYGGPLEEIHIRSSTAGDLTATVRFLNAMDCQKFYDDTCNGLVYKKNPQGREKVLFVELARDVDVIGGLLQGWIDNGFTRSVRAVGVEDEWGMEGLWKLAEKKNRKLEWITDRKHPGGARSVVFRFCKIEDAIKFKQALSRDEDWEHVNIHFAADPCAAATGVHFED